MDAGLTQIDEKDIAKHLATAQQFVTRMVMMEAADSQSNTEIAGTGRRFVSTVSTGGLRKSREVELAKTIQKVRPDDVMLSIGQHTLLYRARRGVAVALAVADTYARQTPLKHLAQRNAVKALEGADASQFRDYLSASAYVAAFTFAAYLSQTIEPGSEAVNDVAEPAFQFDTAQDAVKSLIAHLDATISGASDEAGLLSRANAAAREAIEALLLRRGRFTGLGAFENSHLKVESDNFTIDGFDVAPGRKSKPLVMSFKKPEEVVGNHIAKYQSVKLAKMIMAYDFERQLNPFVDLGGYIFTFIGDGAPGTGKTTLIQMIAGLINDYCQVAGYPFHYENFGVDQISSYQGKSGQNCRQFIDNIINPKVIAFGTIDDIDQVAAKRSDDRASAGQQEITGVLMDAFAGAQTVVRGNATFGMFSNYPENVDDALRQRAGARWLVDGPQTRDDYIDIFALLAGKNHQIPLGEHKLYAAQEIKKAVEAAYDQHDKPKEEALGKVFAGFMKDVGTPDTLAEIGDYLYRIKEREPRFTGRAIKNMSPTRSRCAQWTSNCPMNGSRSRKPLCTSHFDDKKAMISELRKPFTVEMVNPGNQPLRRLRIPLLRQVRRQPPSRK